MTAVEAKGVPETLRAIAAEIREHPDRWTQGTLARNATGSPATHGVRDALACRWCSGGFIYREIEDGAVVKAAWASVEEATGSSDALAMWNDARDRTAEQVADAFDRAATLAESTGGDS